jgi:lipopolysaccharide transport system permease protein
MSAVTSGLIDFVISFLVLIGLMLYYGITPQWQIVFLPLLVLFILCTAFAVALWFSALNVQYRDVQYVIPFLVQTWMFLSPVVYSIELIPAGFWRIIYGLNPMTGVIQGFRWVLLSGSPPSDLVIISGCIVLLLLATGLFYFRRMEKSFADVV